MVAFGVSFDPRPANRGRLDASAAALQELYRLVSRPVGRRANERRRDVLMWFTAAGSPRPTPCRNLPRGFIAVSFTRTRLAI